MSERLDEELRDLLQRKADEPWPPPELSPRVLHRARRRQTLTAALAGATAVLVGAGSFLGARAILTGRESGLANTNRVTETVNGITITYPEAWFLVDPVEAGIEPPTLGNDLPRLVFFLSTYDPVRTEASCPGLTAEAPSEQLVMTIQELPLDLGGGPASAPWPMELEPLQTGDTADTACYPSWEFFHTSFTASNRSFEARVGFGPEVSPVDRDELLRSFADLAFQPLEGPAAQVVLARGPAADVTWQLVVYRYGELQFSLDWQDQAGMSAGGTGISPNLVREAAYMELGQESFGPADRRETVLFGAIAESVARLQVAYEGIPGGGPARGR
jgi:hypothetical protein